MNARPLLAGLALLATPPAFGQQPDYDPARLVETVDVDTVRAVLAAQQVRDLDVTGREGDNPLVVFRDPGGLTVRVFLVDCAKTAGAATRCKGLHYGVCWTAAEWRRTLPTAQEINAFNVERFVGWAVLRDAAGQRGVCVHHAHMIEGGATLRSVTENILTFGSVVNVFRRAFSI
jgi:hypothetical protein